MLLKKVRSKNLLQKGTFLYNAKWSVFGTLFSRVCALLISYVIANVLGSKTFGEYGLIQNTINTFSIFSILGLGTATTVSLASNSSDREKRSVIAVSYLISLVASTFLVIILIIFGPWISSVIFKAPHLVKYVQISSLGLIGSSINGVQQGIFSGIKEFKTLSKINFISSLILLLISIPLIYNYHLIGAIVYFVLSLTLPTLISIGYVKKLLQSYRLREYHNIDWNKGWKMMFNISLPAMLSSFMVGPISWISNTILIQNPNGFFQLGIYNATLTWRMAVLFIPTSLASVALTYFASSQANFKRSFIVNLILNAAVALSLVFVIWFFKDYIMNGYGSEFVGYENVLMLMMITTILMAINNIVGQALNSQKFLWFGFGFNLMWAGAMLILVYYFTVIKNEGALGMAKAQLIAYSLHTIWQSIFIYFKVIKL